ncbi:MAG: hypothetical protein HFE48_06365 [Clostridia bacterium]|nr:hypothetical protein [Clostridia bacterium]
MKDMIKNKGLGYWLCAGAAVAALVISIVVFATYKSALPNQQSGVVAAVLLLAGFAAQIVFTFVPVRFAHIVPLALYTASLGVIINLIAPAIADQANGVHYQGGSFGMCMFYLIAAFVVVGVCIASGFFAQTKNDSEKI